MNCWASVIGDCSEDGSREHLVSKALFESSTIRVQGFPWCKDEPKEVGLSSLTAGILCVRHNNALSNLDAAGARAFSAIRDATRLLNVRAKQPRKRWTVRESRIDGRLLERWFLKTTINLAVGPRSDLRWIDPSLSTSVQPPEQLVQVVFGLSQLADHCGLHGTSIAGQSLYSDDTVGFAPLIRHKEFIVGALFVFRGHRFLLWLGDQPLPPTLASLNISDPDWCGARVHYHLRGIDFALQDRVSHRLIIEW